MMIEADEDMRPPLPTGERVAGAKRRPGEGTSPRAFVILGRSRGANARVKGAGDRDFVILGRSDAKRSADPRIHAVTLVEGRKRSRISARGSAQKALFCTAAERRSNGMDPRVCAASLRSLLRPRMTRSRWAAPVAQAATLLLRPRMTKAHGPRGQRHG
ncbi:hypothetical protein EN809_004920 [Mesorhizobium sp. M2E.F.Ca.ET.166.01.1.1]|nr:hypothetical protein EN862_005645 [Mesorhizobium sp. M2E.F.Ca.ET.219.01.1.1]TGT76948.1 hypothetical protein EN809_004920 [Mesorhizobium sp. M2E.F.Ca.ET.166.01.1.1]TGW03057.1 hypothetical protein EN797_004920 [Mesorhizobium sp. M2E.F.Ca.ET.154.01.1.1]